MTRSIQAFERGLLVLELINRRPGLCANEVAKITMLTRGTAFRMLETLRNMGYISRDEDTGAYFLQRRVFALADGYSEEVWVNDVGRPVLERLGRTLLWPLTVSTPSGISMLVRINTDFQSPLSKNRFPVGHRVSMVASASGSVYLAFCEAQTSRMLVDLIARTSPHTEDRIARDERAMSRLLTATRNRGYGTVTNGDRSGIAVPILSKNRPFATLAMRFFTSGLTQREIKAILPRLEAAATEIGDMIEKSGPVAMHR